MADNRGLVYGNLAHMIAAGVPVVRATRTAAGVSRGRFAKALGAAAEDMGKGMSLGESMGNYRIFLELDRTIVEASDEAGHLSEGLELLSKWYLLLDRMRRIILGGLVFPAFILMIAAVVGHVPEFAMGGFDVRQYITSILKTLSLFYVPFFLVLVLISVSKNGGRIRSVLDYLVAWVPILGKALRHMAISRYSHVFHMMAKAAIPVAIAAEKSAALTGNAIVYRWFRRGAESARSGEDVSLGFSSALPLEFREMWRTGEETGDIDDMAARLGAMYAESAELKFRLFASGLPKVVYALVCLWMALKIFSNLGAVSQGLFM